MGTRSGKINLPEPNAFFFISLLVETCSKKNLFMTRTIQSFLVMGLTGLLMASAAVAQESEPLITDRPDQTESSVAVPHRSFQIEGGFLLGSTKMGGNRLWEYNLPSILLRYGLFQGLELRLGDQFRSTRYAVADSTEVVYGIDDLTIGTKFNLLQGRGWRPEMAVIISASIPLGHRDFTQNAIVPSIIMAASHPISESIGLGYNLGWIGPADAQGGSLIYSLVIGNSFNNLGIFAEIYGRWVHFDTLEIKLDGGMTLLLKNHIQWDLSGGLGLNTKTLFMGTGLTIRLPG